MRRLVLESAAAVISRAMRRARMSRVRDRDALFGVVTWTLRGPDGAVKTGGYSRNLITEVGDQMYGERGAGVAGAPDAPTGMRLGTDDTAPAKTGAGAAIGAYVSGSAKALDSAPTSALDGDARRVRYVVTWGPGVGTADDIAEVVLTNDAISDEAGAEADTIARALVDPPVDKEAGDTLEVVWDHELLGA